jgi:hypothetical protein
VISVVIPTIEGRGESLSRAIASYEDTLAGESHEILIIQDAPTWPSACNLGFERAEGDVIHFSADDLEALPGWWEEAIDVLDRDELPAPVVLNHSVDGEWDNRHDGADGALTHFTRIPMMTRSQYERVGPWPEFQYVADVWVSERARTLGIQTRMVHSYRFVHHWEQVGRDGSPEVLALADRELARMRAEGWPRC